MTFPGLGHQDWVELDLELFDLERHAGIAERLASVRPRIEEVVGPDYRVEPAADGTALILVADRARFHAEINSSGRLVLTSVLDAGGPL